MPGDESDLSRRLRLPETRPAALATALSAVRAARTPAEAASILGVSLRTLHRLLGQLPELRQAAGWPTRTRHG